MAKYISNWYGIYPNSAGSNTATDITSMVSNANDWFNYFRLSGPAGYYNSTPTYNSGYLYNGSDFEMFGSRFFTNSLAITELDIFTTDGWIYGYAGSVQYNAITGALSGALNHIAVLSPTDQRVDFYGYSNVNSTTATITKITDQYADGTIVLSGALSYNDLTGTMTGNITSYQFIDNFGHSYTLSNFSIPFSQLNAYSDLDSFVADIMAGNDNIVGTAASEAILGYAGNDTLDGAGGADTLVGGTGNDVYMVDNIGDVVTENVDEGTDLVKVNIATANGIYTLGDNIENGTLTNVVVFNLTGNSLSNVLTGNAAANTLDGDIGADTMFGGAGNDIYVVDQAGDIVTELLNAGIDTVQSSITYNLFDTDAAGVNGGNIENLTLTGTANIDGIGNAFNNVITGNAGNNILDGLVGNDSLNGGDGDDTLNGGLGNDTLNGGAGADSLTGDAGADSLDGGAGADTMIGGDGNDIYVVDNEFDVITESNAVAATGGVDSVESTLSSFDLSSKGINIENLTLKGSAVEALGNELKNTLRGNSGDNRFDGRSGVDTLIGGLGNDSYFVDIVKSGTLAKLEDMIVENLNEGIADVIYLQGAADLGLTTATTITMQANIEYLNASLTDLNKLNFTGNGANNGIVGNLAENLIDGGIGADEMQGLGGNDTYIVDNIGDNVSEVDDSGTDLVKIKIATAGGNYTLTNAIENATLINTVAYNLTGNNENNILTGNAAVNTLIGSLGNDRLDGGLGNDILDGGEGDDTYVLNVVTDTITNETSGNDTAEVAFTASLADAKFTSIENLTLSGAAAINATGNAGNNTLTGNAAANILNGNGGADTLIGGDGGDAYIVDSIDDVIKETNALAIGGIDLVQSSIDFDLSNNSGENILTNIEKLTLTGTAISATGNALANTLTGNLGDNVLDGKEGVDILIGGAGSDTYEVDLKLTGIAGTASAVASLQDSITEANTVAGGVDTLNLHGDLNLTKASTITLALGLENLDAFWTNTTLLNFTGNAADNDIYANDANNIINGGGGNDSIKGAAGNDIINGEAGDDWLIGGEGDDTLYGGAGLNTLEGGNGNDTYIIDFVVFKSGTDTYANAIVNIDVDPDGIDTIVFKGAIANTFYQDYFVAPSFENYDFSATGTTKINIGGSDVDNKLIGNAAANVIVGYLGNDTLDGGLGIDTMVGGIGDDTYLVNVATDIVIELGGEGTDTVKSAVTYSLIDTDGAGSNGGNVENLELTGASAINATGNGLSNTLTGNGAANILKGLDGDDTLYGGLGNDSLDGGVGADSMTGGDGTDVYVVDDAGDAVIEDNALIAGGVDIVNSSLNNYTLTSNVENLTLTDGTATGGTIAINGTGNELNNIIIGNAGDNVLIGGAGKDTLTGNAGNDTLDGESGVDTLNGGAGDDAYLVDLIETGTTPATIKVVLQDSITDSAGIDTLKLRGSFTHDFTYPISTITLASTLENLNASLVTGLGWLNLTGNALNNTLTASADGGVLAGLGGNDSLVGGIGNDVLDGGTGADILKGGAGDDTYDIDNIADVIDEEGNTDFWDTVVYRINASATATSTLTVGSNINTVQLTATTTANLNLTNIENIYLVGTGKYNLIGNAQQNQLTGNAANNVIDGGDGDDFLNGAGGLDTLIGGAGDDTYNVDNLAELNLIVDNDLNNTLITSFSYALTNTGPFNNLYLNGIGAFSATGNDNDNILWGNGAANILNGGAGADSMDGGDGNDTYIVDDVGDQVVEWNALATGGIDLVQSSVDFDLSDNSNFDIRDNIEKLTLTGTAISATGNALANTLTGNVGDNVLDGKEGVDILIGGAGSDTYEVDLKLTGIGGTASAVASLQDSIIEANTVAGGIDTLNLRGDINLTKASTLTLALGLENLDAFWTNTTLLNITGNAADNDIYANDANNVINGGGGNDHIKGAAGNDIINGEAGDDWLIGGEGDDTLYGGAGLNTLEGGVGNDTYIVDLLAFKSGTTTFADAPINAVADTDGNDTIVFKGTVANSNYQLFSLIGNPILETYENFDFSATGTTNIDIQGSDVDNKLTGNAANNIIDGGLGADSMAGGTGNDTYYVDDIGDLVTELLNAGIDTVQSSLSYSLFDTDGVGANGTNVENLTLSSTGNINGVGNGLNNIIIGNFGNNTLEGGIGNDTLNGGGGDDTLIGGTGNDVLIGGLGFDWLTGDLGADRFVFNSTAESNASVADLITDFSHIQLDKIDLSAIDANSTTVANDAFTYVTAFTGVAGQVMYDVNTFSIVGDTDGNIATVEFFINMWGVSTMSSSDFIL